MAMNNEVTKAESELAETSVAENKLKVGEVAAASGAVVSAGGIAAGIAGACATGGCAIMSAGSFVGGSAAAGPVVMAGAPAYLGAKAINHYAFKDEITLEPEEAQAREAARKATNIGALVGVGATAAITVSNGFRTAAVMTKLAAIGGMLGGSAVTGGVMLALIPIATAGIVGAGVYYAKKKLTQPAPLAAA
ncbi:hypothetical protein [Thiothrix fructosivorans]|uniref:Uncharacterized protein n=2 Tax=Thiothrix fructosivorans TaxID=111770 RepID=A0A8B0SGN5_9GAMM|nr:hypothetical protein [Thiothrix fructosivorans]QTX10015.1 hypothetical protein J1836_015620 [Thiothrix fructosivorans]